jgi:phage shock protein PspC (stress-responsive transcriptional regulator)
MNAQGQAMFNSLQQPRQMVCGVCATLAERSGLPVALIRIAAVILLVVHSVLTGIVYLLAAAWMRQPPPAPVQAWERDGLGGRFQRLDERLARMEAEAYQNEAGLRRAFHDLERH